MSKQAIKRLSAAHKSYDLSVAATSVNKLITGQDGRQQTINEPAIQAIITVFDHGEKGAVILKKSAAYGTGATAEEAQSRAIDLAVEGLGL